MSEGIVCILKLVYIYEDNRIVLLSGQIKDIKLSLQELPVAKPCKVVGISQYLKMLFPKALLQDVLNLDDIRCKQGNDKEKNEHSGEVSLGKPL